MFGVPFTLPVCPLCRTRQSFYLPHSKLVVCGQNMCSMPGGFRSGEKKDLEQIFFFSLSPHFAFYVPIVIWAQVEKKEFKVQVSVPVLLLLF